MNQNFYTRIRILFAAALSVIVMQSFASGGEINQTDANGQRQGYWIIKGSMIDDHAYKPESKVEEGIYLDNRKNGLWKKYWPNGRVRSEINYDHGKPQGEYKLFYDNGKLEEHSNWTNSKNTGVFKRYYDNGNPQQDFLFAENGKRNGLQKYFHENGKLAMEVSVVNGQESGLMRRYNSDGSLSEEKTFENGVVKQGSNKKYKETETKPVVATDPYDDAVGKESKVTSDKTNKAQPFKPNGFNTLYDKNGQITQIGEFTDGRLHDGKWYRYNSNGLLVRIEIYKGGKYVGLGVMEEK